MKRHKKVLKTFTEFAGGGNSFSNLCRTQLTTAYGLAEIFDTGQRFINPGSRVIWADNLQDALIFRRKNLVKNYKNSQIMKILYQKNVLKVKNYFFKGVSYLFFFK